MIQERKVLQDSITDVPGVHVGHFTLAEGEIQTGVSAILPYPLDVRNRKLFMGSFAAGSWNEWTGLHVAQDFGTFSSPIILCNAMTIGIAYDALISFGHQREKDLPIDNAWPPIVIGIDDGYLNDLRRRPVTHDDVLRTIHSSKNKFTENGSTGIGRGLCAFGGKGGVGESSQRLNLNGEDFTIGVFIVANGGNALNANRATIIKNVTSSFIIILATDTPLFPEQLRRLAEAALRGVEEVGEVGSSDQQLTLAFSTSNVMNDAFGESFQLFTEKFSSDEVLAPLCMAARKTSKLALLNCLRTASKVTGRKARTVDPVEIDELLGKKKL